MILLTVQFLFIAENYDALHSGLTFDEVVIMSCNYFSHVVIFSVTCVFWFKINYIVKFWSEIMYFQVTYMFGKFQNVS